MEDQKTLAEMAAQIVTAYVSNNNIASNDIPALITKVYGALSTMGASAPAVEERAPQMPAVPVKKSVTPDYIICLEDGLKFKSLRRHLSSAFDMTPDEYRTKWGLPRDYPMVAPNYAKARSNLAKEIGLGRKAAAGGRKKKGAA